MDLSSAFDTVDHDILLARLTSNFGIKGTCLDWFRSYLSSRTQFVSINGTHSDPLTLKWGVPQGSVLGPLLFTAYMAPLGALIRQYNINMHFYADDTQLYLSFVPGDFQSEAESIATLEHCVNRIKDWMTLNKLKLNDDKTEFLILGTRQSLNKVSESNKTLTVGTTDIPTSSNVRNLGVMFESNMSMARHISKVTSTCYFHLHNIMCIRKYLTTTAAESVIHSLISSRLDYCNSLLLGIPQCQLKKLQRVQNCAARILTSTPKFEHISPVLKELHWLPVEFRVQFKVCLIIYKAFHSLAPQYIKDLLHLKVRSRTLRCVKELELIELPAKLSSVSSRSFHIAGPRLWNSLPNSVKAAQSLLVFKTRLKTHLFTNAFH